MTLSYVRPTGSTATGDAGDAVIGLDRFGRVVDQNWSTSSATVDRFQYQYDRDGNVTSRRNGTVAFQSERYAYDGLNRLTGFARGTLDAAGTGWATGAYPHPDVSWSLDAVGNWTAVTTDGSGTATRTHNAQNQVVTVTTPPDGDLGGDPVTVTLGYDKDGNTLADGSGQQYAYDAWNRLVTVKDASNATVAAYAYDAQGHRVTETHGTATVALYYSDRWQVVEERSGTSPTATATTQYVYSPFYVDELVERTTTTRPTSGTTLNRRLYVTHDANYNTTALTDGSGNVVERYVYDPYGAVTVQTAAGAVRGTGAASAGLYAWVVLFQGRPLEVTTYDFRERFEDVGSGRFGQQDSTGYVNGAGLYESELSSPINDTDPGGCAANTTQPAQPPPLPPFKKGELGEPGTEIVVGGGVLAGGLSGLLFAIRQQLVKRAAALTPEAADAIGLELSGPLIGGIMAGTLLALLAVRGIENYINSHPPTPPPPPVPPVPRPHILRQWWSMSPVFGGDGHVSGWDAQEYYDYDDDPIGQYPRPVQNPIFFKKYPDSKSLPNDVPGSVPFMPPSSR